MIQVHDGYVIITAGDSDLDNIFNIETDKDLHKDNFLPQIPLQLKANRSVLLINVDQHISQNDEEIKK